jgi:amino acid transporter
MTQHKKTLLRIFSDKLDTVLVVAIIFTFIFAQVFIPTFNFPLVLTFILAVVLVIIKILSCFRCVHEWASKLKIGEPKNCPKCKSPYWNRPRTRSLRVDNGGIWGDGMTQHKKTLLRIFSDKLDTALVVALIFTFLFAQVLIPNFNFPLILTFILTVVLPLATIITVALVISFVEYFSKSNRRPSK